MPVKFNKEMLIKHRFWVMLGVAMTLTLTGILCLEFVNADETIAKVKQSMSGVQSLKGPQPNQAAINALATEADKASKSEADVWRAAYQDQEKYFKFSDEVEKKFHFYNGLFATEIKLTKGADSTKWPPDTSTLVHGTVDGQDEISFVLKTRKGPLTLYDTPNLLNNKITIVGDKDNNKISFADLKNMKEYYAAVTFQRGRYFGDPLTCAERREFAESYKDPKEEEKIKGQIHPILELVEPLDIKGNGVVQLKNWLYNPDKLPHEEPGAENQRFINYVKIPWNLGIDFSKGAWIAQEDLWIQKEIYRIIGETNNTVSQFTKEPGNGKDKVQVFKNSYFELNLVLQADSSISFTIKNLLHRRQRLDQSFTVRTNDQAGFKPETFPISGDPLMPKGDVGKGDTFTKIIKPPTDGTIRKGIYDVRQVLTWETAAVKRIDQISIGSNAGGEISHGHRTYIDGLIPFLATDKDAQDDLGLGGPVAPKQPGPGFRPPPGKGPVKGGPQRGAVGTVNTQKIPHDLWLTRYVEVSDQSRRIPVAIALIIDQDHVDRVLLHFNNSKLRFLETQVDLNHYAGSLQPPATAEEKADPQRPFGPPGPGRNLPKGPGAQPGGGGAEMETNMEIVIYGIMTLYQRYPPRPVVAPVPGTAPPAAVAPVPEKKDR